MRFPYEFLCWAGKRRILDTFVENLPKAHSVRYFTRIVAIEDSTHAESSIHPFGIGPERGPRQANSGDKCEGAPNAPPRAPPPAKWEERRCCPGPRQSARQGGAPMRCAHPNPFPPS